MAERDKLGGSGAARWIEQLQHPPALEVLHPAAARLVFSLRLIAIHARAGRDPTAELALRLGSMTVAVRTLQLADSIGACWPEPVQLRRFCCRALSHDEATIAALVEAAWHNRQDQFNLQLHGLIRPERSQRLWADCVELVASESARA
ncbi:MAG TPA: DNA-directed RNA polymerase subunit beta' [Erythrobacter sp.]|nr:DNA-directed RNA polymerase subunit beta' [Erythrobacter sp.]